MSTPALSRFPKTELKPALSRFAKTELKPALSRFPKTELKPALSRFPKTEPKLAEPKPFNLLEFMLKHIELTSQFTIKDLHKMSNALSTLPSSVDIAALCECFLIAKTRSSSVNPREMFKIYLSRPDSVRTSATDHLCKFCLELFD